MKLNGFKKLLMGTLVAVTFLMGIGTATAEAHGRGYNRPRRAIFYRPYRPFWGPYWGNTVRVVDPIASQREEGYSEGRSRGKDDAKEGRENDPDNHKKFNKSKSLAYREAFLKGYADGYRKQLDKAD
jgi:hypothetical protein